MSEKQVKRNVKEAFLQDLKTTEYKTLEPHKKKVKIVTQFLDSEVVMTNLMMSYRKENEDIITEMINKCKDKNGCFRETTKEEIEKRVGYICRMQMEMTKKSVRLLHAMNTLVAENTVYIGAASKHMTIESKDYVSESEEEDEEEKPVKVVTNEPNLTSESPQY